VHAAVFECGAQRAVDESMLLDERLAAKRTRTGRSRLKWIIVPGAVDDGDVGVGPCRYG